MSSAPTAEFIPDWLRISTRPTLHLVEAPKSARNALALTIHPLPRKGVSSFVSVLEATSGGARVRLTLIVSGRGC